MQWIKNAIHEKSQIDEFIEVGGLENYRTGEIKSVRLIAPSLGYIYTDRELPDQITHKKHLFVHTLQFHLGFTEDPAPVRQKTEVETLPLFQRLVDGFGLTMNIAGTGTTFADDARHAYEDLKELIHPFIKDELPVTWYVDCTLFQEVLYTEMDPPVLGGAQDSSNITIETAEDQIKAMADFSDQDAFEDNIAVNHLVFIRGYRMS